MVKAFLKSLNYSWLAANVIIAIFFHVKKDKWVYSIRSILETSDFVRRDAYSVEDMEMDFGEPFVRASQQEIKDALTSKPYSQFKYSLPSDLSWKIPALENNMASFSEIFKYKFETDKKHVWTLEFDANGSRIVDFTCTYK